MATETISLIDLAEELLELAQRENFPCVETLRDGFVRAGLIKDRSLLSPPVGCRLEAESQADQR